MTLFAKEGKTSIVNKILGTWAFAIATFHTLLAAFRYVVVVPDYLPVLRWAGAGLAATTVFCLGIALWCSADSRKKIMELLLRAGSPELFLLIGLLFWFAMSSAVNQMTGEKEYLRMEDLYLFDMAVCILILFPMTIIFEGDKGVKLPELLIHIVVILYTVFTAICLWYIFQLEGVTFPSGEQGGFTEKVQLILGVHYNLTGMIAITMFCLCVYMVFTQEPTIKALYILFGIIQLAVVYLSNSRTIFVGLIVFVAAVGFLYPWKRIKKQPIQKRIGMSLLICAVCVGIFWAGRTGTFVLFERVTHFSEKLAKESGELTAEVEKYRTDELTSRIQYETTPLARTGADNVRKLNNLSNRTGVWKAALKVMGSSPQKFFFGVTSFGVTDAIRDIGGYHKENVAHAHNNILQIGISMGVPAMMLFFVFLLFVAVRSIRVLMRGTETNSILIPSAVLCFTVINMGEAYLVGYFSVMACFFYLLSGWIVTMDKKSRGRIQERGIKMQPE